MGSNFVPYHLLESAMFSAPGHPSFMVLQDWVRERGGRFAIMRRDVEILTCEWNYQQTHWHRLAFILQRRVNRDRPQQPSREHAVLALAWELLDRNITWRYDYEFECYRFWPPEPAAAPAGRDPASEASAS